MSAASRHPIREALDRQAADIEQQVFRPEQTAEVNRSRAALHDMGYTAEQTAWALGYTWHSAHETARRPGH